MKEKILISACLLGFDCKYDGGNNRMADTDIEALRERFELIPVCPECCGGLPTPRTPSEQFKKGARAALGLARHFGIKTAILKANSPSCGSGTIYDGSFTGTLVPGDGVTAELLKKHGVIVTNENALL